MSNPNYTNDILKSLELNSMNGMFFPMPYPDSDSVSDTNVNLMVPLLNMLISYLLQ